MYFTVLIIKNSLIWNYIQKTNDSHFPYLHGLRYNLIVRQQGKKGSFHYVFIIFTLTDKIVN